MRRRRLVVLLDTFVPDDAIAPGLEYFSVISQRAFSFLSFEIPGAAYTPFRLIPRAAKLEDLCEQGVGMA